MAGSQNPCPRKRGTIHKIPVDQDGGGGADNEAGFAKGDHVADGSTLDLPFTNTEVSNTESDGGDDRDDKYLETEGCCRRDTGFKPCASGGRRDSFSRDIPSRSPPPYQPPACTDFGSAGDLDADLTGDLSTPRKVICLSNTNLEPHHDHRTQLGPLLHLSQLSTFNSTTRVRLSWCASQPDTRAIKSRTGCR